MEDSKGGAVPNDNMLRYEEPIHLRNTHLHGCWYATYVLKYHF